MYINELKVATLKLKKLVLLIIGSVGLSLFGIFFFALLATIQADDYDVYMILIIINVILIILSGLLVYKSMKLKTMLESINLYSRYFEGDLDGFINTSNMVKVIDRSEKQINSELNKLLKKKYMINFILKQNAIGMQVILSSKISQCECKNCGAIIDKRVYFTGVCPYCGCSDLFAKLIK